MPYTMSWEEPAGLYVKYTGTVSPADFAEVLHRTTSDPRYDSLRYTIGDFLEAQGHCFRHGDVQEMARAIAQGIGAAYSNPYVFETAVATDPAMRTVLESYASILKLHSCTIFTTVAAARAWLADQSFSMRRPVFRG